MSEETAAAMGFGLASFLLSLHSLAAQVRKGQITLEEARDTLARSRTFAQRPELFPGDPAALKLADGVLKMAEQMLSAALARESPSGPI